MILKNISILYGNQLKLIESTTIDEFSKEKQIPIDLIKLDVEGYEMEVLKGAKNILKKYKPIIAISIYHKKEHMFEIPEFLLEINDSYNFSITANNGTFIDMVLFAY